MQAKIASYVYVPMGTYLGHYGNYYHAVTIMSWIDVPNSE